MSHLTTNYREFISHRLNEQLKKADLNTNKEIKNRAGQDNWWAEMRIEFEKIMKESDEIYNAYWGKIH